MNSLELDFIGSIGHLITALAFLGLALFVVVRWHKAAFSTVMLAAASATTCAWGLAVARDFHGGAFIGRLSETLEVARSCGWLVLVLGLLYWVQPVWRVTSAIALLTFAAGVAAFTVFIGSVPG